MQVVNIFENKYLQLVVYTQKMLVTLMVDLKKPTSNNSNRSSTSLKAETSFNQQQKKHSSQAKYNTTQTNIRSCKIPLRITEESFSWLTRS